MALAFSNTPPHVFKLVFRLKRHFLLCQHFAIFQRFAKLGWRGTLKPNPALESYNPLG
jgi:hypothetical protein